MLARIVREHGYPSVCRRSIINSEPFKQALTFNGQDVASLYLQVLELGGRSGYMKYRHRAGLPAGRREDQQGDRAHRDSQQDPAAAMRQAQAEALQDLRQAGVRVDE